jgi:hypothetical protein
MTALETVTDSSNPDAVRAKLAARAAQRSERFQSDPQYRKEVLMRNRPARVEGTGKLVGRFKQPLDALPLTPRSPGGGLSGIFDLTYGNDMERAFKDRDMRAMEEWNARTAADRASREAGDQKAKEINNMLKHGYVWDGSKYNSLRPTPQPPNYRRGRLMDRLRQPIA